MKRRITMGTLDLNEIDVLNRVVEVLKSGMLSAGPMIDEFERQVAKLHGKERGIFVNSGQSALEVALMLAKFEPTDSFRVLVPTTTYAATLWAILRTGHTPVFCDIDPTTFCMDYSKAPGDYDIALPVDLCGYPSGRPPNDKVFVIEDACEAVGNPKCTYGDIICGSFYVSHLITTGGGGMLCLNSPVLETYARSFISHGRTFGGDFTKYSERWTDRFFFDKVGASYRGDSLHAALGLSQLTQLEGIIDGRRKNATVLCATLDFKKIPGLQYPSADYVKDCVFQFVPLVLDDAIDRQAVLTGLFKHGIDSRVLFPLTTQPIFRELYGDISADYPVSARVNSQGFIVGCHQHLDASDMEYLADALDEVIRNEV